MADKFWTAVRLSVFRMANATARHQLRSDGRSTKTVSNEI